MNRRNFFKGLLLAVITPVALRFGGGVVELPVYVPKPTFEHFPFQHDMIWVSERCKYDEFIVKVSK